MNTRWFALYVRRRRDHAENMSAGEHRQLTENVQLAMSLGASVVFRESEDVVGTILEFMKDEKVSLLVVGRPSRRGFIGRMAPPTPVVRVERAEHRRRAAGRTGDRQSQSTASHTERRCTWH